MKRLLIIFSLTIVAIVSFSTLFVMGQSSSFQRMDEKPKPLRGTLQPLPTKSGARLAEPQQLPPFVGVVNTQPVPLQSRQQVVTAANTGSSRQNVQLVAHHTDDDAPDRAQSAAFRSSAAISEQAIEPGQFELPADFFVENNQAATPPNATPPTTLAVKNQPVLPQEQPLEKLQQEQESVRENTGNLQRQQAAAAKTSVTDNADKSKAVPNVPQIAQQDNQVRFAPQASQQPQAGAIPLPPPLSEASQTEAYIVPSTNENGHLQKEETDTSKQLPFVSQLPPAQLPPATLPPSAQLPSATQHSRIQPAPSTVARTNAPVDIRYDGNTIKTHEMVKLSTQPLSYSHEDEGTGVPGPKDLAGAQTPQLVIEKIMPPEMQINEPASIKISVRNTGTAKAKNVVLTDRVPKGAKLFETGTNTSRQAPNGDLVWELGDIGINEEKIAEMRIVPMSEGEIGSVAAVTFYVEASGSSRVTKPALTLEVKTIDRELLVGGDVVLEIVLSNPGSGTAKNIILEEYVPDGLSHLKGKELRSPIGDLGPSESKHLKLTLKCERPGETTNYLVAKADNGLMVESKMPIVVLSPGLKLAIDGPKVRYLERKATYALTISNPGSAATRDVALVVKLPRGIEFVSTDSNGIYDPNTNSVHWALDELPAQQSGNIELVTLPKEIGDHTFEFSAKASNGLTSSTTHEVSVDGIAALGFEIANKVDPVELGRDAIYEIRVYNLGSKASSNIELTVQLPEGMRFVSAEGPSQNRVTEGNITFDRLMQLAPKEEKTYQVKARCLVVGDQRIKVQIQSDELAHPVTKEESTKVYGDE